MIFSHCYTVKNKVDPLFEKMPEHVKELHRKARKEQREKARKQWKDKHVS